MHEHDDDAQHVGESMQRVARQRRADLDAHGPSQRVEVPERAGAIKVSGGARRVPQRFEDAVVCAVLRAADAPSREEVRVGPVREATSGRGPRARVPPRRGGRDAVERAEHEDGDARHAGGDTRVYVSDGVEPPPPPRGAGRVVGAAAEEAPRPPSTQASDAPQHEAAQAPEGARARGAAAPSTSAATPRTTRRPPADDRHGARPQKSGRRPGGSPNATRRRRQDGGARADPRQRNLHGSAANQRAGASDAGAAVFFQAAAPPIRGPRRRATAVRSGAHPVPLRRHALRPAGDALPSCRGQRPRAEAQRRRCAGSESARRTDAGDDCCGAASTGRSTDELGPPRRAPRLPPGRPRACLRYRAAQARAIVLSVRWPDQ